MADGLYTKGLEQMGLGNIDLENDTIKLAPMATSYTPDYNTDQFWDDVSASLASGASSFTLTNTTFDIDTGNSRVEFNSDDVAETGQTFTSDKFILYKDTGVASTSPLIMCGSYVEGTLSPVSGDFNVTVNVEGFFSLNSA